FCARSSSNVFLFYRPATQDRAGIVCDCRTANAPPSLCSPPRNCSHEALPFIETSAKAKLAGSIKTRPGDHLAAFSAFCIGDIPITTARNKDVRSERVMFGFHCREVGLNITYPHGESLEGVLKSCRRHDCS